MNTPPRAKQNRGIALIIVLVLLIVATCLIDGHSDDMARNRYPKQYSAYVEHYAKAYDLPPHLIYAVIRTESDFDSSATSAVGAIGLMQLLPDTFRWISDDVLRERLDDGMIYDPETNIKYGTYYLSRLYDRYGDWDVTFAAYNGGSGNVDEWLADSEYADGEGGLKDIPFRETRSYVKKVNKALKKYERLYGKDIDAAEKDTEANP